jgi:hypothetical protein
MILVSCWRKKGGEAVAAAVAAAAAAAAILIVAAAKLEKSWKAAAAAAAAAEILVMAALLAELAVETWRTKSLILEWVPLQQHLLLGEKAKLAGCSASLPLTLAFAPPTLCVLYS